MIVLPILLSVTLAAAVAHGQEIRTRYATLVYSSQAFLRQFDDQVFLSSLPCPPSHGPALTAAEEVGCKLDAIVDRVETILDIFPRGLNFTIVLLPGSKDVQNVYMGKYGRSSDYIAFYSPRDNTVYVSVNDVRIGVMAHELTHVIIDKYFSQAPPAVIQELVARYVDSQIDR